MWETLGEKCHENQIAVRRNSMISSKTTDCRTVARMWAPLQIVARRGRRKRGEEDHNRGGWYQLRVPIPLQTRIQTSRETARKVKVKNKLVFKASSRLDPQADLTLT